MAAEVIRRNPAAVLTLDEVREQCRIDADLTDDDTLLQMIERAAVASAEARIGGPLLLAECCETLDAWPGLPWLYLDIAGGREVVAIEALQHGQRQPLPLDAFHIERGERRLCIKPLKGWPVVDPVPGAIAIVYRAGFAEAGPDVPEDVRQWLRFRVATLYAFREEVSAGSVVALPDSLVDSLIAHYRPTESPL
ncbi:phage head-tail connector protein [Chromobacterium piscinae]|uniref:Phage head-tail connector protein n=1 Tax=Chromobacterium piscinae TaxID=686831 RepID=A0ABV0H8X9_9NEIS